jgi:hypothetical protein
VNSNVANVDLRIRELGNVRLALREDLVIAPGVATGQDTYAIEDPLTSKFYYVGAREYAFLTLLDGELTVGDALKRAGSLLSDT